LGVLSTVGFARAEPIVSSTGGASDLPVAVASFPAEAHYVDAAKVNLDSTAPSAAPMHMAPAGSPAAPAVVAPAQGAPSTEVVTEHEGASYVIESPTMLELGVLSLVRMIEQGTGLLAVTRVGAPSSDEQAFDDAAAKELRRLTFMRRLSQMHDQENERQFSERLTQYLRKTEFRQALETQHLAPSPFERSRR
jgi:hypothetical protein